MVKYCALCDWEATRQAIDVDGHVTLLCGQCATAFELGQARPNADLESIDTDDEGETETCPECGEPTDDLDDYGWYTCRDCEITWQKGG